MTMNDVPGGLPGIMGIFAHPDDESFGLAGTLARATAHGHPAAIVCATRGEVGKIADPSLATPENLGQVREGELRAACAAVGIDDVSFLDYVDGQFSDADEDEVVGRIVYHLRRFRPAVVATFSANGGYGHPDHMAIHRYTLAAITAAADPARYPEQVAVGLAPHRVRKVYYTAIPRERLVAMRDEARKQGQDFIPGGDAGTIPFEEMGTPIAEISTVVTLTDDEFVAKQRSMRAHATQMPADSPFAKATPQQLREFMGRETLVLAPPPISDQAYPAPEDDVFAGL
ncbi:MAG TPA: PIG-L family deacetylase [Ktedonobacterales bacterium]|nr:PIG-L family deacetylase [Ktedonobacterales bacterium]